MCAPAACVAVVGAVYWSHMNMPAWRTVGRMLLLLAAVSAALLRPGTVHAASVRAFDARVTVRENATIEVAERIEYDFEEEDRHGIFRTIPYSYQAGTETYIANISSVLVTDGAGVPLPFDESRGNGELTVKIGDPDRTVRGVQTYVLSYVVTGPFLYWDDADELYWNVTGTWSVPILRASVLVDLPPGALVRDARCYEGTRGSNGACKSSERLVSAERAGYTAATDILPPGGALTVSVSFPKGVIAVLRKPWERVYTPLTFLPLALPAAAALGLLLLWYVRGRDPRGRGTLVTEFAPPEGMGPALAGVVYDERLQDREVTAEIVRLAVEGYLKIHRIHDTVLGIIPTDDYLLVRTDAPEPNDPLQKELLAALCQPAFRGAATVEGAEHAGTLLSKMRHLFVEERRAFERHVYEEVVARGFFPQSPHRMRARYYGWGIGIAALGFLTFLVPLSASLVFVPFAVALVGCVVALMGRWMPVRTAAGVYAREHLEGFKRYLAVAEKDRLQFHNAPERMPAVFDAYLPYAIVFGVEDAWALQYREIYTTAPSWYDGGGVPFTVGSLSGDMHSFTSGIAAAVAPRSSGAGGGGSVGGGFGGGRGGSW